MMTLSAILANWEAVSGAATGEATIIFFAFWFRQSMRAAHGGAHGYAVVDEYDCAVFDFGEGFIFAENLYSAGYFFFLLFDYFFDYVGRESFGDFFNQEDGAVLGDGSEA